MFAFFLQIYSSHSFDLSTWSSYTNSGSPSVFINVFPYILRKSVKTPKLVTIFCGILKVKVTEYG